MKRSIILLLVSIILLKAPNQMTAQPALMRVGEVYQLPVNPPTARIPYGKDSLQFGELRIPAGEGPFPVIAIIHGGCWLAAYDLSLMDAMATDLTNRGYATWNIEYRRVGDEGGGWPGTFQDISAALNHLREVGKSYPLDLKHVVVTGHSAGGHLAIWQANRRRLPKNSPVYDSDPLPISGVVSLAGIVDLETYLVREGQSCGASVGKLLGGFPEELPERYRQASPMADPYSRHPLVLLTGAEDPIVPVSHVRPYFEKLKSSKHQWVEAPGAGHFEVIAPGSNAWPSVVEALESMLSHKVR